MERVTIREASQRLRIPTAQVRECIRGGELQAFREEGSDGQGGWVVELPDDGWISAATTMELNREFSPWWWGTADKTGYIHYVESLSRFVLGGNGTPVPLWRGWRQHLGCH